LFLILAGATAPLSLYRALNSLSFISFAMVNMVVASDPGKLHSMRGPFFWNSGFAIRGSWSPIRWQVRKQRTVLRKNSIQQPSRPM
jgi:hypothetical protein